MEWHFALIFTGSTSQLAPLYELHRFFAENTRAFQLYYIDINQTFDACARNCYHLIMNCKRVQSVALSNFVGVIRFWTLCLPSHSQPLGLQFTDDAVMLASLHPSLRYMQLDAFISDCVSVAAKHHGNPSASNRSFRGYSPASRLCNSTLEHLLDRKTSRLITRRGQMPCYTVPGVGSWSPFIDLCHVFCQFLFA